MDMNSIIESAKLAVDFVKSSAGLAEQFRKRTEGGDEVSIPAVEVAELTTEILNKLIEAKLAQLALLDALRDLKGEMVQTERRLELQSAYDPLTTRAGALVLVMKPDDTGSQPVHYICPDCADAGRRSFLQPQGTGKRCHPCEKFFPFDPVDNQARIVPVSRSIR